jgi:DNA polymerase
LDITLDFETRSRVDLKRCGLYRYAEDESTTILCASYMLDDTRVIEWNLLEPPPLSLFAYATNPNCIFHAFNAQFEIELWKKAGVRMGWPEPPPLERWRDTMAECGVAGYPQSLEATSRLVNKQVKSPKGLTLIKYFSIPDKTTGEFQDISLPHNQIKLREFQEYCSQDVRSERSVHLELRRYMSDNEQLIWRNVVRMNQRGLPVDIESVNLISEHLEADKIFSAELIHQLTNGAITKPTQTARIKNYVNALGCDIEDLTGDTVQATLEREDLHPNARRILEFRALSGKSSTAKFASLQNQYCSDGTVKGNLRYYGALTGRHAGLGFQPQNLPQYRHKNPDEVLKIFKTSSPSVLRLMYAVEKAASGLIRHMIQAPEGYKIIVNDFSGVEAVGTAWLCREWDLVEAIRKGMDIYLIQASKMYNTEYEKLNKKGPERQAGKIAVLACGYAGGYIVYIRMAAKYKVHFTEIEAKSIVSAFRKSRPLLTKAWKSFEIAAIAAVASPGEIIPVDDISCAMQLRGRVLCVTLPSGRAVYYPGIRMKQEVSRFGQLENQIWAYISEEGVWAPRQLTGPLLFQNAVQGLCRDFLVNAQVRLDGAGYTQHGSVHDEAISIVPDTNEYTLEGMNSIMCELPEWAKHPVPFPLKGDGYEGKHYKK